MKYLVLGFLNKMNAWGDKISMAARHTVKDLESADEYIKEENFYKVIIFSYSNEEELKEVLEKVNKEEIKEYRKTREHVY